MSRIRTLLAVAVLACVLAAPSFAQGQAVGLARKFVSFGVGGGVAVPMSDAADALKNGIAAHGFVRFNVPKLPVAPRMDLNYERFNFDDLKVGAPGTSQVLSGLANLQFSILNFGPVRPYVIAGLGAYHLSNDVQGTTPSKSSDTRFGINGGAGIAFKLGSLVNGFVEGRVDNVYTEAGMIDANTIQVVPVTFGLTF